MKKRFFVTGTDTDAGKTFVTVLMLEALKQRGLSTLALKPLAAGCEQVDGELRNDDALKLQAAMTVALPYQQINPIALKSAIAPHLAAEEEGRTLSVDRLAGLIRGALMTPADVTLVEGAGGWLVPLNHRETLGNLVKELELPVILVVGVRLGCLNHALLTAQAVAAAGLPLAGWVANGIDPEAAKVQENINTLKSMLPAPCLGVIPHGPQADKEALAQLIDIDLLLQ
ncbi:MAG: dethiobiotin synthase [Alcanivorax sp.]|uniref:dethiobiotin synthase n=1 Tax=unclassified Ketobacter TaxID=2639109 RepID=UPI000F2D68AC|nr:MULTISPECIES: dethiobiotin synthase [unclassified Ketobacter]MEC8810369.1 dethiobiotin synthase [Pseudomonadota bacterium]TNC90122.1 MAG: dethiobiotin synthase [Alcanivorax sp.]MCK5790527.1 dethiobiotin synthase [Ketobacter sp.]RLT88262.1 MAG: dethiobiotin synthase [Ketobacter sp. GenoA1]RLT94059.1 MAG: dethiobiotin synthase [Ketobacter sp.]